MKFNLSLIDYVWYTGERFHQQEHNPGDGTMLIMISWFCTLFLPLLSIVYKLKTSPIIQITASIILLLFPFLFCHFRYTPKHKEALNLRYKNKKNWGRRLLIIWGSLIIIVAIEVFLLSQFGVWHI